MIIIKRKENLDGILLRIERIKQDKGQKEICSGICAVSTLSKIEMGKQGTSPEILVALYGVLGIKYVSDSDKMQELKKHIENFYQEYEFQWDLTSWEVLKEFSDELRYSPYAIDWLIINALMGDDMSLSILNQCRGYLEGVQLGWYLLCGWWKESQNRSQDEMKLATQLLQNSYSILNYMHYLYHNGYYKDVLDYADKAISMALEEGNLFVLTESYMFRGNIYACINMEEMMLREYEKVIRLLKATSKKEVLKLLYYNIGATYLSTGRFELAEKYLNLDEREDFYSAHKKCLLYCRTQRPDLAQKQYIIMENSKNDAEDVQDLICRITSMELSSDVSSKEFIQCLESLVQSFYNDRKFGFMMFYKPLLQEAYTKQKMYKKAFELELMFPRLDEYVALKR